MFKKFTHIFAAIALIFIAQPALAKVEVGQPAPDFEATDINGNKFKLSDHKGELVVLEWTNHQCPFVMKHYSSGNMQKTQKIAMHKGAKWISIVSSAPGRQGHTSAAEAKEILEKADAQVSSKILDESGEIGKLYGAATTPHMFIIDKEGTLIYAGAIDSNSSPRAETIETATNYVLSAIANIEAGEPVEKPQTQPYGCAVKYAY